MGTSKGYQPPTGYFWRDVKRSVSYMKHNNFSSKSIGKSLSNFSKAINNRNNNSRTNTVVGTVGARALNFFEQVKELGLGEALKEIDLGNLDGGSFHELYVGIVNYFSENNNSFDDSIVNNALQECMKELFKGVSDSEEFEKRIIDLNRDDFLKDFFAKYVEVSFFAHFKEKVNGLCKDLDEAIRVQGRISDFIKNHIKENYKISDLLAIDFRRAEGKKFITNQINKIWGIFEKWSDNR